MASGFAGRGRSLEWTKAEDWDKNSRWKVMERLGDRCGWPRLLCLTSQLLVFIPNQTKSTGRVELCDGHVSTQREKPMTLEGRVPYRDTASVPFPRQPEARRWPLKTKEVEEEAGIGGQRLQKRATLISTLYQLSESLNWWL